MNLRFTKMHGLGNDFIVIDAINQKINLQELDLVKLSNRHTGIGFDQCLIVEATTLPNVDFFYRIFNADGQEVGQCGNGARCLAYFLYHYKLTSKTLMRVATNTTTMQLQIHPDATVSVFLEPPKLDPKNIPMLAAQQAPDYELQLHNNIIQKIHAINVGNPHAIIRVDHWPIGDISALGNEISNHPNFPEQTNVGFMYIENQHHIKLRVFERGSQETQACGSGAVAAMAIGRLYYNLHAEVTVSLSGGDLSVTWENHNQPIVLRGDANIVYEGQL
jgi:diaminopimelate epimerase